MIRITPFSLLRLLGAALLAMIVVFSPVASQDDDDDDDNGFGAYIHEGACADLGDTVEDLEDLELDRGRGGDGDDDDDDKGDRRERDRVWDRIGGDETRPDRLWAEREDDIDMSLQELVDGEYAIAVHEGPSADSSVIACGAITGELDEDCGLLIDLEEYMDSGYEGRAYLIPDDDDDEDDDDDRDDGDDEDDGDTEVFIGIWEVQPAGV